MTEVTPETAGVSRRAVVAATGLTAAATLAGCKQYTGAKEKPKTTAPATTPGAPVVAVEVAKVADVPVGGGVILGDKDVVVTQPTAGQFKAFSATCTHEGCTVTSIGNGTINCACHGSKFNLADGSVNRGPAGSPLGEKKVTVTGDSISVS